LHQKLTFWNFIDIIVDGAQRRPLILRPSARFFIFEDKVRVEDFQGENLLVKKVSIRCDFLILSLTRL